MNRDIKFRGKRLDNGAWETGGIAPLWVGTSRESWCIVDKVTGYHTPVHPDTVGQSTGLCDKSGREIYEGDVITHGRETGEIVWLEDYATFGLRIYASDGRVSVDTYPVPMYYDPEIIGNTSDNPEFVK